MLAAPQELTYEVNLTSNRRKRPVKWGCLSEIMAKDKAKILGLVLLIVTTCFAVTYLSIQTEIIGYKIDKIKQEINALQRENERLQLEITRLKSPERVAKVAVSRLGMIEPQTAQMCYVPGGNTERLAGMLAQKPLEEEVVIATTASQSLLYRLSQVLKQWLNPVRVAEAGG